LEFGYTSALKTQYFAQFQLLLTSLARELPYLWRVFGGVCMSAITDTEFLRLLKKDVDYFKRAIERFENLIPNVCAPVQDQWRLQVQARKNFTLDLEILLDKAEQCVHLSLQAANNDSQESASC
jgi:hypothetical protein